MNTIAIDNKVYQGAEKYAKLHNISISEVIEKSVLLLLNKIQTKQHVEDGKQAAVKSWVDVFAGKWQDKRSTPQIIKELHEARTSNSFFKINWLLCEGAVSAEKNRAKYRRL